jgi:hypothetical protein
MQSIPTNRKSINAVAWFGSALYFSYEDGLPLIYKHEMGKDVMVELDLRVYCPSHDLEIEEFYFTKEYLVVKCIGCLFLMFTKTSPYELIAKYRTTDETSFVVNDLLINIEMSYLQLIRQLPRARKFDILEITTAQRSISNDPIYSDQPIGPQNMCRTWFSPRRMQWGIALHDNQDYVQMINIGWHDKVCVINSECFVHVHRQEADEDEFQIDRTVTYDVHIFHRQVQNNLSFQVVEFTGEQKWFPFIHQNQLYLFFKSSHLVYKLYKVVDDLLGVLLSE